MKSLFASMIGCFSLFISSLGLTAEANWPSFRGPDAAGISDQANLPATWSSSENVSWKTDIAGRGWSSPIVWEKQIFLTTVINEGESEFPKKGL